MRSLLGDVETHSHEILRVGCEPWSRERAVDDVAAIPFAIDLPSNMALPSSLKLRSKDGKGRTTTSLIEYAIVASVTTPSHRHRASCPITFAPLSPGLPELTLSPSRLNPPVLDGRWSISSEVIKISRSMLQTATTEFKLAVPNVTSVAAGSTIPFVVAISARSARHNSSASPDLAVPQPSNISVILSQSHASPRQPTLTRDICSVFSFDKAKIFDTGITYRGTGSKGRHERTIIAVSKFSYAGACSFKGDEDRISVRRASSRMFDAHSTRCASKLVLPSQVVRSSSNCRSSSILA